MKNIQILLKCKICGYDCNKSIGAHVKRKHNITAKDYYDKYLKKENDGICVICGKNTKFSTIFNGYRKHCSNRKCSGNDIVSKNKMKKTCLERYGTEHSFQNEEVKNKIKETNIDRYGVPYPNQSKEILDKTKKTCIIKYNVEYVSQLEEVKNKVKETNIKKYGVGCLFETSESRQKAKKAMIERFNVEYPFQSKEINKLARQTCIERYGYDYTLKSEEIQNKIKQTNLEKYGTECIFSLCEFKEKIRINNIKKYGVPYPMQNSEFAEKQSKTGYKHKDYILPSGKIIKLQGYEPIVMDILLESFGEDDILTSKKEVPEIWYFTNDSKKHRYYPDIYVPKENLIIEVKSTYTYEKYKYINLLKEQACIDSGYNFEFIILDNKHKITNIEE